VVKVSECNRLRWAELLEWSLEAIRRRALALSPCRLARFADRLISGYLGATGKLERRVEGGRRGNRRLKAERNNKTDTWERGTTHCLDASAAMVGEAGSCAALQQALGATTLMVSGGRCWVVPDVCLWDGYV
jgi:hypothetical protein